jgi:WD40 repeat protein
LPLLAYSSDARVLFTCGRAGTTTVAALWDVKTGKQPRSLLRSLGQVRIDAAAFRPGGRELLLACDDGRVRLWDVSRDSEIDPDRPLLHPGPVARIAVDAAGERLLSGCRDGTARLWDLRTRTALLPALPHDAEVNAVAFSPDGRTLLTSTLDGALRFWDAASGEPLGATRWHRVTRAVVDFHPDGSRIATSGEDGIVRQWHAPAPPWQGSPEQARLWVEELTGLTLDEQGTVSERSAVASRTGVR